MGWKVDDAGHLLRPIEEMEVIDLVACTAKIVVDYLDRGFTSDQELVARREDCKEVILTNLAMIVRRLGHTQDEYSKAVDRAIKEIDTATALSRSPGSGTGGN